MAPPVIGLTLDHEPGGGWSKFPWYAIRENYCNAVRDAGGLPVLLPHEPDAAGLYLDRIDGLIVTGGGFDVDPALFGARNRHPTVTTKDRRTAFELAVTSGALAREMPVLGICGGQQLLNVALGGTLIQHIPDEVPNALAASPTEPAQRAWPRYPNRRRHFAASHRRGPSGCRSTAPTIRRSRMPGRGSSSTRWPRTESSRALKIHAGASALVSNGTRNSKSTRPTGASFAPLSQPRQGEPPRKAIQVPHTPLQTQCNLVLQGSPVFGIALSPSGFLATTLPSTHIAI